MRLRHPSSKLYLGLPLLVLGGVQFAVSSCSSDDSPPAATGGTSNTGGTVTATGGVPAATGGTTTSTGGTVAKGGSSSGGVPTATGGTSTGGSAVSGGTGGAASGAGGKAGGSGGAGGTVAGSGGKAGGTGGGPAGGTNGGGTAGANGGSGGSGGGGTSATFKLTSPDHAEGAKFADKYTCKSAGFQGSLLPELAWTPGPAGTKSYAITFIDVTLTKKTPPDMNGYHWVIYNIPATTTGLPEEFKDAASLGAKQNSNYLGPCPGLGTKGSTDTYEFTLYALSAESLTLNPTTGTGAVKDAETKLEAMNLAKTKLTGTSDASPP